MFETYPDYASNLITLLYRRKPLPDTLPRAAMQMHRITSIRPLRIVPHVRIINASPSIVGASVIQENIEC